MADEDGQMDICSELGLKILDARENLASCKTQEELAFAAREYEALQDALDEVQLFTQACPDLDTIIDPSTGFHRDLYGRRRP